MFNQLKDMGNLAKKAKEMKEKMKTIQGELKTLRIETDENGIKIVMTGEMDCVSVEIKDEKLLQPNNKEKLQKVLAKVYNKASQRAKSVASSKLSVVSKGLNIPGL
tara:strand:+ start:203 stop:520 length:318 start_codon:yes stop_codon:yes gene_type:complete